MSISIRWCSAGKDRDTQLSSAALFDSHLIENGELLDLVRSLRIPIPKRGWHLMARLCRHGDLLFQGPCINVSDRTLICRRFSTSVAGLQEM